MGSSTSTSVKAGSEFLSSMSNLWVWFYGLLWDARELNPGVLDKDPPGWSLSLMGFADFEYIQGKVQPGEHESQVY